MQTAYRRPQARVIFFGWFFTWIVAISLAIVWGGCISAPPKKPSSAELARHENALGSDLARQFESKLHYHFDPVVERYLTRVAGMIAAANGDLRLTTMKVVVISDSGKQWRSFSLPGRKIYFPLGLLRSLHFDNEIAAVIALEDGNIIEKHAIHHLTQQLGGRKTTVVVKPPGASSSTTQDAASDASDADEPTSVTTTVNFFGPMGIFTFDTSEMKASVQSAALLMYNAGFDMRGLLKIWQILEENPTHSPFSQETLEELSQFTRETISLYAPLRDPIVGTSGFKSIQKRIQTL